MEKINTFYCNIKDKVTKESKEVGRIEIKNLSNGISQLHFYGDIASDSWESWEYNEDKCPKDIKEFLEQLDGKGDIEIYVNSGGGSVYGGLAIYNQLKRYQGKKTAYIDGIAGSIASIIPFACDEIIIYKSSQMMIHKPWCGMYGNADELRKQAEVLDSCQELITSIYMDNVKEGIEKGYISELVNNETFLTGSQIADLFNVRFDDGTTQIVNSIYYQNYKNKPIETVDYKELEIQNQNNVEIERLRLELEIHG